MPAGGVYAVRGGTGRNGDDGTDPEAGGADILMPRTSTGAIALVLVVACAALVCTVDAGRAWPIARTASRDSGIADRGPTLAAQGQTAGPQLAWFIWGRRGKSRHIARVTISWPQGLEWPKDQAAIERWGTIRLAAAGQELSHSANAIVAIRQTATGACNGLLGPGEWEVASAWRAASPAGPLLVMAKWEGGLLYVAVALPAVPDITGRTQAILTIAPPGPAKGALPKSARAFLAGWDGRLHVPASRLGMPRGRRWRWRDVKPEEGMEDLGFLAALSPAGDGALNFAVAEFAVRLADLGIQAQPGLQIPAAVFVRGLPPRDRCKDVVRWPWGYGASEDFNSSLLCEHPDGWAEIVVGEGEAALGRVVASPLARAPALDGRIDEAEWDGGTVLRNNWLGAGWIQFRAGVRGGRLFFALACKPPRSNVRAEALECFIDPEGDGGLLARPDDRLLRLEAGDNRASIWRWEPPPTAEEDKIVTPEGRWENTGPSRAEGVLRAEGDVVIGEMAVPLSELGISDADLPKAMRLMLRLVYLSEPVVKSK